MLLLAIPVASAQEGTEEEGWSVESLRVRFAYFDQRGRGPQSQADVRVEEDGVQRGSMDAEIYHPAMQITARQNDRVRHSLTIPIDVVTSASADALDAVSTASRVTEAFRLDFSTTVDATAHDHFVARYGLHIEEPFKSGFGGFAYRRDFAQDNTTIEARGNLIVDIFDPITPQGFDVGQVRRNTVLGSIAATQVLSPTTLAWASYGLTYQWGTLQNTWNAVPVQDEEMPVAEVFPGQRLRHALAGGIAQHLPASRTTLRLRYRYYTDDFDLRAHTAQGTLYQWLGRRAYAGVSYRWHEQTAVSFYQPFAPAGSGAEEEETVRTADSDLAAFTAHRVGGKLVLFLDRDGPRGNESVEVSYYRYWRPRLDVDVVSLGYSRVF